MRFVPEAFTLIEPAAKPIQKLAYTISEAAAMLSISRSFMYELIRQGTLDMLLQDHV